MILTRVGNKSKLAKEIQKYFPKHKIYIELFFGAGGMFFNKPKAKYNIVNDLDSDVFNLFQVIMNQKEEIEKAFYMMPIHSDLWKYWKKNKEVDPIKKALRFLLLSNFSYLGKSDTLRLNNHNASTLLYKNIKKTYDFLFGVDFMNYDFRDVFKKIPFHNEKEINESFVYADPPYLNTGNNYSSSFTEKESIDLFDCLQKTGCKWAMSEFNNLFILDQAEQRKLNVHIIGERKTLKNRQIEILITNYKKAQLTIPYENKM